MFENVYVNLDYEVIVNPNSIDISFERSNVYFYDDINNLALYRCEEIFVSELSERICNFIEKKSIPESLLNKFIDLAEKTRGCSIHSIIRDIYPQNYHLFCTSSENFFTVSVGYPKGCDVSRKDWKKSENLFKELSKYLEQPIHEVFKELPDIAEECRIYYGLPEDPPDEEI